MSDMTSTSIIQVLLQMPHSVHLLPVGAMRINANRAGTFITRDKGHKTLQKARLSLSQYAKGIAIE